jgi:AraC family transcriptional regulator
MFLIRDTRYEAGEYQLRHAHDELQISIILRGSMNEDANGVQHRGLPGDVVVKPAGTPHANDFQATRIISLNAQTADENHPRRYGWHRSPATTAAAMRFVRDHLCAADLTDASTELLASLAECVARDRGTALRAARILEERFSTALSLGAVAEELRVHPVYLSRVFRAQWDCTPSQFLMKLRVRDAARALSTSGEPLSGIAVDCGFSDQPHFTRSFRRVMGMTPAEFRRLAS